MEKQEMDSGLELLKKVIKSNEENIENITKINLVYDDILNLIGEFESSARGINYKIRNFENNISKIPMKIETSLTEDSVSILENFEKKAKALKYLFYGSLGVLAIAVLAIILSFYFSKQWYMESILTKREIRTQIFAEMNDEGKDFYKKEYVNQLELNMKIINKWMEKNPKEADKFLRFKEGDETK